MGEQAMQIKFLKKKPLSEPEIGLNLDLATKLMFDACLLQLCFEEHFDGDNEFARLFARQIDAAKLSRAEWFANVKVIDRPSFHSTIVVAVATHADSALWHAVIRTNAHDSRT